MTIRKSTSTVLTIRKAQNNTVNTYIHTKAFHTHSHLLYDYTRTPAHSHSPPHKHTRVRAHNTHAHLTCWSIHMPISMCSTFLCPNNGTAASVWDLLTCTLMPVTVHGGCTNTVRESALKVDCGRKIPCHTPPGIKRSLMLQRAFGLDAQPAAVLFCFCRQRVWLLSWESWLLPRKSWLLSLESQHFSTSHWDIVSVLPKKQLTIHLLWRVCYNT